MFEKTNCVNISSSLVNRAEFIKIFRHFYFYLSARVNQESWKFITEETRAVNQDIFSKHAVKLLQTRQMSLMPPPKTQKLFA